MPADKSSLTTKIRRANLVPNYDPMDSTHSGWEINNNRLVPVWYEGSNLPRDTEYKSHIDELPDDEIPDGGGEMTDSFCSEWESHSDEYALSERHIPLLMKIIDL